MPHTGSDSFDSEFSSELNVRLCWKHFLFEFKGGFTLIVTHHTLQCNAILHNKTDLTGA